MTSLAGLVRVLAGGLRRRRIRPPRRVGLAAEGAAGATSSFSLPVPPQPPNSKQGRQARANRATDPKSWRHSWRSPVKIEVRSPGGQFRGRRIRGAGQRHRITPARVSSERSSCSCGPVAPSYYFFLASRPSAFRWAASTRSSQCLSTYSGRPALEGDVVRHVDGVDHVDRVPGADLGTVLAADAAIEVDVAPGLQAGVLLAGHLIDAVDRADLDAGLAPVQPSAWITARIFGMTFRGLPASDAAAMDRVQVGLTEAARRPSRWTTEGVKPQHSVFRQTRKRDRISNLPSVGCPDR